MKLQAPELIRAKESFIPVYQGCNESLYEVQTTNTAGEPEVYRATIVDFKNDPRVIEVMVHRKRGGFAQLNQNVHRYKYNAVAAYVLDHHKEK